MTVPRGFKANAERVALQVRDELGVDLDVPLDICAVAPIIGASIVRGEDLVGREPFEELESQQVGVFSAATFHLSGRYIIVTNPLASEARRRSDIAHEMGHLFLKHELTEMREVGGVPFRTCRPDEEEQATTFGGTLLLPRPMLLSAVRRGITSPDALARIHNVSLQMARFRLHSTGVLKQASRTRYS